MAIVNDLLNSILNQQQQQQQPVAQPQSSWVQDLINSRNQPQNRRIDPKPMGFQFKREPFDPSSYYRALGTFRDVSRMATAVSSQIAANREANSRAQAAQSMQNYANTDVTYDYSGKNRKYGLSHVSSNVAKAADYWGSKYGIGEIGGWRAHGSVPGSDHPKGLALDFMTYRNKKQGTALANDLVRNYKSWNIKYVIWNRYIWTPSRGWHRYNGPSPHTDHVHASFYK